MKWPSRYTVSKIVPMTWNDELADGPASSWKSRECPVRSFIDEGDGEDIADAAAKNGRGCSSNC